VAVAVAVAVVVVAVVAMYRRAARPQREHQR